MFPYLFVYSSIALSSLLFLFKLKKGYYYACYVLLALMLIVFAGLRNDGVGFDYNNYRDLFQASNSELASELIEPCFKLLIYIVKPLGDFHLFLLIVAILSLSIKFFFFSKYSNYPFISFLVYFSTLFLLNDMGQIRYGLALSFAVLYYHQLFQNRWKPACLFLLLAILFHFSAIILLLSLPFARYNFSKIQILLILLSFCAFYLIDINDMLKWIQPYIPITHIRGKIQFYTAYTDSFGKSLGPNISLFLRLLILYGLYWCKTNTRLDVSRWNMVFNMYFIGILVYMIFSSNAEFATRGSGFFKILELIILPLFVTQSKGLTNKVLIWSLIALYSFYSLGKVIFDVEFGGSFLPYSNVLLG